jgi:hypothetical protein
VLRGALGCLTHNLKVSFCSCSDEDLKSLVIPDGLIQHKKHPIIVASILYGGLVLSTEKPDEHVPCIEL